jgi:hypothetical protein
VRRVRLETKARLGTMAGRVEKAEKVKKAERVEKVRMPRVQQGSIAIQTRRLEK